jgi:hypothetical protein
VALVAGLTASAWAHEEQLVIGTVQRLDVQQNLLVVHDPERDRTVRLVVDSDTRVQRCRRGLPVTAVQVGSQVRVKYMDTPGKEFETLSILILPGER